MHRCLVSTEQILSGSISLNKEESRHLRTVLRIQQGTPVELFDGRGLTAPAAVTLIEKNSIHITASSEAALQPAPACAITLFVCISKGKRMDWTVEKATELGVAHLVPVISDRTIVRLSPQECDSKAERWRRVAEEAARQCGSAWIPEITPPVTFEHSLGLIEEKSPVFTAALTSDAIPLRAAVAEFTTAPTQTGWYVGPEGDFTPEELDQLRRYNTRFVSLGSNVLRAETASLYGLCVLACAWL